MKPSRSAAGPGVGHRRVDRDLAGVGAEVQRRLVTLSVVQGEVGDRAVGGQVVAIAGTPAGSFGRCRTPNGPYHSAHAWIMGTPPRKKQPFDPSAPGMSPTPAPELIGTQARSAGWPMAPSFSWFSAVEEQPARPTLPLDHSCAANGRLRA
jgi:hypothetical protein